MGGEANSHGVDVVLIEFDEKDTNFFLESAKYH